MFCVLILNRRTSAQVFPILQQRHNIEMAETATTLPTLFVTANVERVLVYLFARSALVHAQQLDHRSHLLAMSAAEPPKKKRGENKE